MLLQLQRLCRAALSTSAASSSAAASGSVPMTLIRELRARSAAPVLECKKALAASALDVDAAIAWLRGRGVVKAAAAAASARCASQGVVALATSADHHRALLLELSCETDFVARNEAFVRAAHSLADAALRGSAKPDDIAALLISRFPDGRSASDVLADLVLAMRENIAVRRIAALDVCADAYGQGGVVASYLHNRVGDHVGQIGALVALRSRTPQRDQLLQLGRKIAMHVTVAKPLSVSLRDLSPELVTAERSVQLEKAAAEGVAGALLHRVVDGRMNKFFQESCLEQQVFALGDDGVRVHEMLQHARQQLGANIEIASFQRLRIGEALS